MRLGLKILHMPLLELKNHINKEVEQNPLLEWKEELLHEEKNLKCKQFFAASHREEVEAIPKKESIYEKLVQQINEVFSSPEEKRIAHLILRDIDEKGMRASSIEEIAKSSLAEKQLVEKVIKEMLLFEPLGIGSKNLQEFFLLQLKEQNKELSFAYRIVQDFFLELIHAQFSKIAKGLKVSQEELLIILQKDLSSLKFSPLPSFSLETSSMVNPDFFLQKVENRWVFQYHSETPLALHSRYLHLIATSKEDEKKQMEIFFKRAVELMRGLQVRKITLKKIAFYLLKKQIAFFEGRGALIPLTISKMAQELHLHPSTCTRAVAYKYVSCPQGILALRSFFTSSIQTNTGKSISQQHALQVLKNLVQQEDKKHPFSDKDLSLLMNKADIPCARRTVVKYRKELSIQTASKRRRIYTQIH